MNQANISKKPLGDCIISWGNGLSSSYLKDGDTQVQLIKTQDITWEGKLLSDKIDDVLVKKTNALKSATISEGDIIISTKGENFKVHLISPEEEGFVIGPNLICIRIDETIINPQIVALYLRSQIGTSELQKRAGGAALKSIKPKNILDIEIPVPSMEVQEKICSFLSDAEEYLSMIETEQAAIAGIMDTIVADLVEAGDE